MAESIEITTSYRKNYSYAELNSGYRLFDWFYLENCTSEAVRNATLRVSSSPVFVSGESEAFFLSPFGHFSVCPDFVALDENYLMDLVSPSVVAFRVDIVSENGEVLATSEKSLTVRPYGYFTGFSEMPESVLYFIGTDQKEIRPFINKELSLGEYFPALYDAIKALRVTFTREEYSAVIPKKVKFPEEIISSGTANTVELAVFCATCLELSGFECALVASAKGKVFIAASERTISEFPLGRFSLRENATFCTFLDAQSLAYGSELPFESAIHSSYNSLLYSDEKFILIDIRHSRKWKIQPLPERTVENGKSRLVLRSAVSSDKGVGEMYDHFSHYSGNERIMSVLAGKKLKDTATNPKENVLFDDFLDVNQNKILSRIVNNDFTLIRARHGSGATTVFAKAAASAVRRAKNVLYITDPAFNSGDFTEISSEYFSPRFVLDTGYRKIHADTPQETEKSDREALSALKKRLMSLSESGQKYYNSLEGEKRITDSFLAAADRFCQFRESNDAVSFSPEDIKDLSDDTVKERFGTVADLAAAAEEVGKVSGNPLSLIKNKNHTDEFAAKVKTELEGLISLSDNTLEEKKIVSAFLPSLGDISSLPAHNAVIDLIRLIAENRRIPEAFFENHADIDANFKMITKFVQSLKENERVSNAMQLVFNEQIFEIDAAEMYGIWQTISNDKSFRARAVRHSVIKEIKKCLNPNCDVENIEYILASLVSFRENEKYIRENNRNVHRLIGATIGDDVPWDTLLSTGEFCYQIFSLYRFTFDEAKISLFISELNAALENDEFLRVSGSLAALNTAYRERKENFENLISSDIDSTEPDMLRNDADYFSSVKEILQKTLDAVDGLKSWCAWLTARENAVRNGLVNVVLAVESGKLENSEIKKSFIRAFFKAICSNGFKKHPELAASPALPDTISENISSLLSEISKAEKRETDMILSERRKTLPEITDGIPSLRDMIKTYPNVFPLLYPCVVSTPEKAEKLFSDSDIRFDYIFVESRNKIKLEDFIWLFEKGEHIAFAGDFAEDNLASPETLGLSYSAFDYLWKICEEKYSLSCVYKSSPAIVAERAVFLQARSASARCYSLPDFAAGKSVDFVRVYGTFNLEQRFANLQEAEYAVRLIDGFSLDETSSLGIATSTKEQKELVLRLIAVKLSESAELKNRLIEKNKKIFVYALSEEKVFADNLVFLTTFAPDRSAPGSRMPLESSVWYGSDPMKRITELLSAVKSRLTVVSSFDESDLYYSPGVFPIYPALLFLLKIARAGRSNNTYSYSDFSETGAYISLLCEKLDEKKIPYIRNVQSGRYFFDLVTKDENGDFDVAVISDNTVLNQASNTFKVEMQNLAAFRKLGWKVFRLRTPSAYLSFENEAEKLFSMLKKPALKKESEISSEELPDTSDTENAAPEISEENTENKI